MICQPCTRQLKLPGKHRAHKGCQLNVILGSAAGPCACPSCFPFNPDTYIPPDMHLGVESEDHEVDQGGNAMQ